MQWHKPIGSTNLDRVQARGDSGPIRVVVRLCRACGFAGRVAGRITGGFSSGIAGRRGAEPIRDRRDDSAIRRGVPDGNRGRSTTNCLGR
jgi:hypothetical protein